LKSPTNTSLKHLRCSLLVECNKEIFFYSIKVISDVWYDCLDKVEMTVLKEGGVSCRIRILFKERSFMSKNFSCTAYDDYKLCILNKDSHKGIIYDIRYDLGPRLEASELLCTT
jgi:hypothetical protein